MMSRITEHLAQITSDDVANTKSEPPTKSTAHCVQPMSDDATDTIFAIRSLKLDAIGANG